MKPFFYHVASGVKFLLLNPETNLVLRLIPILLLFTLVFQTGFKVILYADYQINKEKIAQKYCENKAKPEMKCHGKCHLKKQMKEDDKRNNSDKNKSREQIGISLFVQHTKQVLKMQTEDRINNDFFYLLAETEKRAYPIFHPPSKIL